MRELALFVLVGCSRPAPVTPSNVAAEPASQQKEDVVIEHDEERIQERGRDLYEEARRRAASEDLRAKIRDGRIVCTPTGNTIHGPSAICTEKQP